MAGVPTRPTLILRIRDPEDQESWEEFVEIYTPLVYGFCLKRGLQSADARDILQTVLQNIFRAIQGFDYDRGKGTFRSWLYTITRREISRMLSGAKRRPFLVESEELDDVGGDDCGVDWDLDYRLRLFRWACEKVEGEFARRNWQAFYRTAVMEEDPEVVGEELGLSRAAVYMSRSRVLARLREKVAEVADESWEMDLDLDQKS